MIALNKKNLLAGLHDRTEVVRNNLQPFFRLSPEMFNWKPSIEKWSIAQVFEHLIITQQIYLRHIGNALTEAPINGKEEFTSGWLGDLIYEKIMPRSDGTIFTIKSPRLLHPSTGTLVGKEVLNNFMKQLDELDHVLELSTYVDLQKIKIPLSISKFIKLRLGDSLRFLVAHNERHLLQAQKVLQQLPTGQ